MRASLLRPQLQDDDPHQLTKDAEPQGNTSDAPSLLQPQPGLLQQRREGSKVPYWWMVLAWKVVARSFG